LPKKVQIFIRKRWRTWSTEFSATEKDYWKMQKNIWLRDSNFVKGSISILGMQLHDSTSERPTLRWEIFRDPKNIMQKRF